MKILTVVGARPQFVKAAIVSRALRALPGVHETLVHTGQHYDENMSSVFFEELEIPLPDHNLNVGSGSHGAQTGHMLEAVERVMMAERPDWVLTYGDTNSTLAGALAAAKLHLRIAHVEAGLRSFNRRMPEEINRIVTDQLSDLLFAPTETAVAHLTHEGVAPEKIHPIGDVMYDAAIYYGAKATAESRILERLGREPRSYILSTVHRAENTDDPERLCAVMEGLMEVAETDPVVLPLHPRTRATLERAGLLAAVAGRLTLIEPVGYLDMVALERNARLIATDSGGVQKEAFFHGVPCVTLREETEWVELVESGWNRLCPPRSAQQVARTLREAMGTAGAAVTLYGGGEAARRIAATLAESAAP